MWKIIWLMGVWLLCLFILFKYIYQQKISFVLFDV